jgi:hypothetical protein
MKSILYHNNFCKTFISSQIILKDGVADEQNCRYSGTSVYVLNPFQILGLVPNRTYIPMKKNPFVIGILYCTLMGLYKII